MIKWIITVVLASGIEPMISLETWPTEQECKNNIEVLSKQIDSTFKVLSPYPRYSCIDIKFNEDE